MRARIGLPSAFALVSACIALTGCSDGRTLPQPELARVGLDGDYPIPTEVNPDVLFGHPVVLTAPAIVRGLGLVPENHGRAKMAIFAEAASTQMPAVRLAETGAFEITEEGAHEVIEPTLLPAGRYWIGAVFETRTWLRSTADNHRPMFYQLSDYAEALPAALAPTMTTDVAFPFYATVEH